MKGYFEGWYYKFADKKEQNIGALIPGVSFDADGSNAHAFVQFLDGSGNFSNYYSYDIQGFTYSSNKPEIQIGNSFFSPAKIEINVTSIEGSIKGTLFFRDIKPWPVSFFSPGAMGWYAFVPFMQCYHGVVSFDHGIEGRLLLNSREVDFSGGRGYIEKDWGRSFPSYHIWLQTNHFAQPGTSLMVSIANIPWLGRYFDGFLIGFWYEGRLYRFTTYTGARISFFQYEQNKLRIHVKTRQYRLEIEVPYIKGVQLRTPVLGDMRGRLSESLSGEILVSLFHQSSGLEKLVFNGSGRHAGLEIEGRIPDKLKQ